MVLALVLLPPLAGPLGGTEAASDQLWRDLLVTLGKVTAFVVLMVIAIPNAMEAGHIIEHGRALNGALDIMARAHTDAEVAYLQTHGVDRVVTGEREIADGMVARMTRAAA